MVLCTNPRHIPEDDRHFSRIECPILCPILWTYIGESVRIMFVFVNLTTNQDSFNQFNQ